VGNDARWEGRVWTCVTDPHARASGLFFETRGHRSHRRSEVQAALRARPWRHGLGMGRRAPRARDAGRGQAHRSQVTEPERPSPLRAGGARRGQAAEPARRAGLRLRHRRQPALPRDGAARGQESRRAAGGRGTAQALRDLDRREPRRASDQPRPRRGFRAPRSQAGQRVPARRQRRPLRQGTRFRHRQGPDRAERRDDPHRSDARDARLREPRADRGQRRGHPLRSLEPRCHDLRVPDRAFAVQPARLARASHGDLS
jgi:hypothetical protein